MQTVVQTSALDAPEDAAAAPAGRSPPCRPNNVPAALDDFEAALVQEVSAEAAEDLADLFMQEKMKDDSKTKNNFLFSAGVLSTFELLPVDVRIITGRLLNYYRPSFELLPAVCLNFPKFRQIKGKKSKKHYFYSAFWLFDSHICLNFGLASKFRQIKGKKSKKHYVYSPFWLFDSHICLNFQSSDKRPAIMIWKTRNNSFVDPQ